MGIKVAVIGGGSSMFVPALVRQLLQIPCFQDCELRLMDVDLERAAVMEALAGRLAKAEGRKLLAGATSDRREAVRGADFVIITVSVGGMDAWAADIEIPARHGVFMHIADSIGPGGISRALRNAPIVAEVAKDASELAPGAFVLNYTNPASVNTMVMAAAPVRSASLCSCSPRPRDPAWLAERVGAPAKDIIRPLSVGGINHCTGIFSLKLRDGTDAMRLVRERTPVDVVRWAIDTFGAIPYCWEHWTEFFPQLQRLEDPYEGRAQGLRMRHGRRIYDMDVQTERVRSWERVATAWASSGGMHGLDELPHGPEDDGIVVGELLECIVEDRPETFIVNVMNSGLVPNLPGCAAVEVPAVVDGEGLHPMALESIPEALAAVLSQHVAVQSLTAKAALKGDRSALVQAMTLDPLVASTLEPPEVESLTEDILRSNREYLPNFW